MAADSDPPRPATADVTVQGAAAAADFETEHLARFEFSEQGTKILMVEWSPDHLPQRNSTITTTTTEPDAEPPSSASSTVGSKTPTPKSPTDIPDLPLNSSKDASGWEVSWPGKSTVLPARDSSSTSPAEPPKRRIYFLLSPDAQIPPTVTISRAGYPSVTLKPLPAIFPEGFDVEPGSRGVLHTLWAKKRASELEAEMEAELRANSEGVGLQMAIAERDWIVENFLKPAASAILQHVPMTPRSPIGGRLGEKLKGLKLGTSPADLIPSPTANTFTINAPSRTLSPTGTDMAVSSFAAMSRGSAAAPMSLNAVAATGKLDAAAMGIDTDDDGLFALPMSPRSPDMIRSPFSAL